MLIIEGHRSQIRELAFSPDGAALASIAGKGHAISLWNAGSGKRTYYLSAGSDNTIYSFAFSPIEPIIAAVTRYNSTLRWHLKTPEVLQETRRLAVKLAYHPNGQWLIQAHNHHSLSGLRSIWLYEAKSLDPVARSFSIGPDCRGVLSLSVRPDGEQFAVSSIHNGAWIIDFDVDNPRYWHSLQVLSSDALASSIAYSPDNRLLALATGSNVLLWDVVDKRTVGRLEGHQRRVNSVAVSPNGRWLLSGSNDETVRLWDLANQREIAALNWEIGKVSAVSFESAGMRAAAGGFKKIMVWDVED